jgi:hypothetical protein
MQKTIMTILCFAAGLVYASDEGENDTTVPEVSTRLEMIEEINVTAEKPVAMPAEESDDELDAILDEADALDAKAADDQP